MKQSTAASHVVSARDIGAERQSAFGRWRPAPVIRISAAVHLAGVAAVALDPLSWPYIGAALVANHAALGLGVMMPRSTILGPNLRSLPQPSASRGEIALTFDDGPDPAVTPRILDQLDRYGARASFFCIYVSWTRRGLDTVDGDPTTVLARLVRELSAGDILLLHDAAGTLLRRDTAVAVSVLPVLMERIAAAGLKPVSLRTACLNEGGERAPPG